MDVFVRVCVEAATLAKNLLLFLRQTRPNEGERQRQWYITSTVDRLIERHRY